MQNTRWAVSACGARAWVWSVSGFTAAVLWLRGWLVRQMLWQADAWRGSSLVTVQRGGCSNDSSRSRCVAHPATTHARRPAEAIA